jgi:IclR family mhp operon transcriptional activator
MVIRDSTHSLTTLTLNNYFPGYSIPILECASGLVYLAHMSDDERNAILESLKRLPERISTNILHQIEHESLLADVRLHGYASRGNNSFTRNPGKTSSIAVPIIENGHVAGALTLGFFSTSMRMNDAIVKFVEHLKVSALEIASDLEASAQS